MQFTIKLPDVENFLYQPALWWSVGIILAYVVGFILLRRHAGEFVDPPLHTTRAKIAVTGFWLISPFLILILTVGGCGYLIFHTLPAFVGSLILGKKGKEAPQPNEPPPVQPVPTRLRGR